MLKILYDTDSPYFGKKSSRFECTFEDLVEVLKKIIKNKIILSKIGSGMKMVLAVQDALLKTINILKLRMICSILQRNT